MEYQANTITREYLKSNTKIKGWLVFFLVAVVLGGLFNAIYPIINFDYSTDITVFASLINVVIGILLLITSFLTLYSFILRNPDAVFLGKTYILAIVATNLISILLENEAAGFGSWDQLAKPLSFGILWFSYLCLSEQVATVIPVTYRKVTPLARGVVIALIAVPILFISIVIAKEVNNLSDVGIVIEETDLSEGELTDGIVAFSVPDGFTCERQYIDGVTLFTLTNEEGKCLTLCSDNGIFESEETVQNYWEGCENEEFKKFFNEKVVDEKRTIKGNNHYYKVKRYYCGENKIYCRFSLIFDSNSSKVCLIYGYDTGDDNGHYELARSIRFE